MLIYTLQQHIACMFIAAVLVLPPVFLYAAAGVDAGLSSVACGLWGFLSHAWGAVWRDTPAVVSHTTARRY